MNKEFEETQKLVEWIYKILKEFGTCDVRNDHVQIPIYRREETAYTEDFGFVNKKEYIEIPSITLIKMG